jgi:hypothetical protein
MQLPSKKGMEGGVGGWVGLAYGHKRRGVPRNSETTSPLQNTALRTGFAKIRQPRQLTVLSAGRFFDRMTCALLCTLLYGMMRFPEFSAAR